MSGETLTNQETVSSMSGRGNTYALGPKTVDGIHGFLRRLKLAQRSIVRLRGECIGCFDFPRGRLIDQRNQLTDTWENRGLFITWTWTNRQNGIGNVLIVCTNRETWERFLRILSRLAKRKPLLIQGVFSQ